VIDHRSSGERERECLVAISSPLDALRNSRIGRPRRVELLHSQRARIKVSLCDSKT